MISKIAWSSNELQWFNFKIVHQDSSSNYRQVSNINRTLVDNKIVDHSDASKYLNAGKWIMD